MLTLEQILTTIDEKLIEKYTDIEINSNDVEEGFDRPSFYVKFDNVSRTDYLYNCKRSLTVRIYYFPSDRYVYQLEVLEKQQEIEDLFREGFEINNRYLKIVEGIESYITDGVLQMSFDVEYYDKHKEDDGEGKEKMQELYLKGS
ncbi:hypothetical protein SAMN05446037_100164 [Anaerovirgula multivorans]|uniref:Phage protein n=1 Tax=Anaerovirgula multivorans TaxID=312168 RepID=A0A238ZRN3_9FIRM|nr:hypothetical protein [Anaerovirgula multivorans]SNR86000.1 hypothetical protein SAMN05446037_100164 [Anaerovirgula multivorans]